MKNNILILGDGLLGSELHKLTEWDIISRQEDGFDITCPNHWNEYLIESFDGMGGVAKYNTIINCIAHTNTYALDKELHWEVNYKGVANLVDFCNKWNIKLVHISTDYVYENSVIEASENDVPVHGRTWYAYTKLLADAYIELKSNNYLICRGTHKPFPFPYKHAFIDQIGNFDYVPTISYLIKRLIETNAKGIYNVGTSLKSIYDLAIQTSDTVLPIFKPNHIPSNTSMNIDKLNSKLRYG